MIIGIDISSIQYGTGVSNYTLNLVKNLIKIDKDNTYKLFYSSLRNPIPPEIVKLQSKKVKIYHFKIPVLLLAFIWNRLPIFPIELFIGKCHVFHTSDYYHTPSYKAKLITTVHDLTAFLYPQWLHPTIVKNHQFKFKKIEKYSHIICVSLTTQHDLIKYFPQIKNKTSVIYEAGENKYSDFCQLSSKSKKVIVKKIKQKYLLGEYILAQGTREPRKNLSRLIKAFINLKEQNPNLNTELVISGKYGWGSDISANQPPYIKILGYLPEADLVPLHAGAIALAYPSLYEGFGLPVLKSMAVGTPVITSQNSPMAEISQNSAILVKPTSIDNIKDALYNLITNSTLRQKLSRQGITTAKKYSWTKTAQQTLNIYSSL